MRLASWHSIVIAVAFVTGFVAIEWRSHVRPVAASGVAVPSFAGPAIGALVSQRERTRLRLRVHQSGIVRVSRPGGVGEFAAASAHEINRPFSKTGNHAPVATTEPGKTGACLLPSRPIIESDCGRPMIERAMNGAVVCFMLAIAKPNNEARA